MIAERAKAIYEADTLRDLPRAWFLWYSDRCCRTFNVYKGRIFSVDVRVWDNGSFEIEQQPDEPVTLLPPPY